MAKVTIVARISTAEGKRDEALGVLAGTLAEVVAEDEPGAVTYSFHADRGDETTIWAFEVYANEEALAAHGKSDRFREVSGSLGPLMAGRPEVHVCDPAGGHGFDL